MRHLACHLLYNSSHSARGEVAKPPAGGCASITSTPPSKLQVLFHPKRTKNIFFDHQLLKLKRCSVSTSEAPVEGITESAVREEILTKFHKHLTHKSKVGLNLGHSVIV